MKHQEEGEHRPGERYQRVARSPPWDVREFIDDA
jgi:hypothetical protein